MSRPLGLMFKLPHGLSNSVLLPAVTRFSWTGSKMRYAEVSRAMQISSDKVPDDVACEALADWLDQLNNDLHVPRLRDCCGGNKDKFQAVLPKMAADALDSGSPQNNPVVPAAAQIIELFEKAW